MNDKTKDKIKKAYFHPITGYRSSREIGKQVGVNSKIVKEYLSLLENKQIFRKPRLKYNTIKSFRVGDIIAADLLDMSDIKADNDGYRYILNVIDYYSRFLWSKKLKSKTPKPITEFMEPIIKKYNVKYVNVDGGSEFNGMTKLSKEYDFKLYIHDNKFDKNKMSIVERVNKTIRQMIYKYIDSTGNEKWIDHISNINKNYNTRVHTTVKHKPIDILLKDEKNEQKVKELPKYPLGQYVRIYKNLGRFEKKTRHKFSKNVFKITKVLPHSYQVQNIKNKNKLIRNYVYSQLLPIKKEFIESKLKVKEILEKKKVKRKKGYIERHRNKFRIRREVDGKKKSLGTFNTRAEAEKFLQEYNEKFNK